MKRLQVMIATLAIHILYISPLAVGAGQYPASGSAAAQGSAAQAVETASQAFDRMYTSGLTPEERAKVNPVLKDAHEFVVLPNVLKVGIGLTQIQGRSVLAYRDAKGVWPPPIPLLVSGQGVGPHFGLIAYDALIPAMKQISFNELLDLKLAVTGKEAIGPVQTYSTGTSGLAYVQGKWLYAGIVQDNIRRITLDQQGIIVLYRIHVDAHEIAAGRLETCRKPMPSQKLIEKVNEVSGRAPLTTSLIDATIAKCAAGKGEPV